MRRCQIMIQFECGKTSFFKCQKKETLMHKINSKWYCWMYGPRILQKKSPDHLFQVIRWSGAVLTLCSPKKLQLTSVFSFSVSISFFLLFHSFVIAVLPSQWFSPCVHPCTPMLHLFGWHLKQVTVIPHNNIMPFFEYILSIFQVLLPDQPERSETNIKSKQPIYLPTILISGHKNAPVRRTWKMDKS